jgi:hypothetical protein
LFLPLLNRKILKDLTHLLNDLQKLYKLHVSLKMNFEIK